MLWLGLAVASAVVLHAVAGAAAYPRAAAIVNLTLAALFAATLRRGREPMIATFARAERGTLEPDLVTYTRRLTQIWVGFFVAAAIVLAALSVTATPLTGAWIAVGNWIAIAALFVGEWVYRRFRFRHYRHASPFALAKIVVAHWRRGTGR